MRDLLEKQRRLEMLYQARENAEHTRQPQHIIQQYDEKIDKLNRELSHAQKQIR